MPYLVEFLLFATPFALYALWRWLNPDVTPNPRYVLLALIGVGFGLAGAYWYGKSRSMPPGTRYVAPRYENGRMIPGHAEPK